MSEEEKVKGVSPKIWAYITIWTLFWTILVTLSTLFIPQPWASGSNLGPSGFVLMIATGPYMVMWILSILVDAKIIKPMRKDVLALIYITTLIVVWWCTYKGFYCSFAGLSHARLENQEIHGWALPNFWMPSAEAIRASFFPHSEGAFFANLNEWLPVTFTWSYFGFITAIFSYGLAIIYRRLWVDIEMFPFPHAQGWLIGEMAAEGVYGSETARRRKKVIYIAAIITFIWYLPFIAYTAYPGLPDFYGWLKSPYYIRWAPGAFQIQDAYPSLRSIIAGPLNISTNIIYYAVMFLAPIDALLSITVAYLLFMLILPQILYYFGYYSGIFTATTGGKNSLVQRQDPLKLNAMDVGMAIGIFLFHFIANWRYYLDTLKRIKEKVAPGDIPYLWGYLLAIVGALGLVALFVASGVRPWVALWAVIVVWFQFTVFTRGHAYTAAGPIIRGRTFFKWIWGETMQPAPRCTAEQLFLGTQVNWVLSGSDTFMGYAPLANGLDSFKVASMAGLSPMDAFKAMMIATVIVSVIHVALTFYWLHYFGFMVIPASKEWDFMWTGDSGWYNNWPAYPPYWPHMLAGIVIAVAIYFMRLRYAWWPLEPIGFCVALNTQGGGYYPAIGSLTAPIVWIIKYVLIKIGGRRAYEEYGVPAALGIIAGYTTGVLVNSLVATARWAMGGV
ncbi:hypothetical protein DRJ17_06640 [Candidatus Woesearchaeota archaeon]|nr:MAG: hypothetical protein DRJ17_06640 [Candidatus Woesearchaeota archaeon]